LRPCLQAFRDHAFDRRGFGERESRPQIDAAEAVGTDGLDAEAAGASAPSR
jgi:hypothetical protein